MSCLSGIIWLLFHVPHYGSPFRVCVVHAADGIALQTETDFQLIAIITFTTELIIRTNVYQL